MAEGVHVGSYASGLRREGTCTVQQYLGISMWCGQKGVKGCREDRSDRWLLHMCEVDVTGQCVSCWFSLSVSVMIKFLDA